MKKIQNLGKIILLIMIFVVEFFLIIASYSFLKIHWIFMAYVLGKIFSITLLFPILKVKFSVADIVKRIFLKEIFFITVFEDFIISSLKILGKFYFP